MAHAPDPTFAAPHLGWTAQHKHRKAAEPPQDQPEAPEAPAAERAQEQPGKPRRGRPRKR